MDFHQECCALTPSGNGVTWKIFLSCVLLPGKTEIKLYKEEQCTQHWGPINGFVDNAFSLYILPAFFSYKVSERNGPVKSTLYNYYENGLSFVLSAEQGLEAG